MKVEDYNTMAVSGNLHPRGTKEPNGPFGLRIGARYQPDLVKKWKNKHVLVCVEQPNEEDNFTLLRVLFLLPGRKIPPLVAGCKFRRARYSRKKDTFEVRIRKRYADSFLHPPPIGQYIGSCMYEVDGGFAVFTLQAISLRKKEPEPQQKKTIVAPGDPEYDESLRDLARAFPRDAGVGRGGADPGGLRDGELHLRVPPGVG